MSRESRPHVLDLDSTKPVRNRSSTSSLDIPYWSRLEVSPEPAYIAQAAAVQIVTNSHAGFLDGVNVGTQTTPVTAPALRIVNQFLDYLLYSFLESAKSTLLPALRSAITAILRKRLAGDAILGADDELHSYLGGTDEEEVFGHKQHEAENGSWDLERAWKQVRVRCMVYSSLGDLEEEDDDDAGDQDYGQGVVSPAVAIWLAAILEFVGEQSLLIAGQASLARYSASRAASVAEGQVGNLQAVFERPMVEGLDTEKVALNPSLGRIWRQWRKHTRGISTMSVEGMNNYFSNSPSASKPPGGSGFSTIVEATTSLPASSTGHERCAPGLDSVVTPLGVGELDRNVPDLEEDKPPIDDKIEEDTDGKNPPTPQCLNGAPDITEFEGDNTDLELWLMKYGGDHRPRSMIMFPWTVSSQLDFPMDEALLKRPRSLPSLDTSVERITFGAAEKPPPENRLVDGDVDSILDVHRPEVARSKIDKMMDRINMVTLEQAELQKQLVIEKDFHSQVLGSPETIIASALQKGLAISTVDVDDTDFDSEAPVEGKEVVDLARTSSFVKGVPSKEITVTDMGRPKRRVKGKSLRLSIFGDCETDEGCDKITDGPLQRLSYEHLVSDEVGTTVAEPLDDSVPTPTAGTRKAKDMALTIISPSPTLPISSPLYSKPPSSNGSVHSQSRKGSVASSIYSSPSTPSTSSGGHSTRLRMHGFSSYDNDLGPFSSMSKIVPRAIHTSGSITSVSSHRLKPFKTWPTDSGKRKETDDYNLPRRPKTTDDKARSFEQLIQSGGTIMCTLTPNEIRDIEPLPTPAYKVEDLAEFIRNATPDRAETPRPVSKVRSIAPRDARVDDTSSSRELALFLSSTGPPQHMDNQPKVTTPHSTQDTTHRTSDPIDTTSYLSSPEAIAPPPPSSPTSTLPLVMNLQKMDGSPSTTHSHNKKRLIAREATGSTGDSTSVLADFFRNTLPPMEGENVVQHRIPRHVAPFRTTLDSDRFDLELPSEGVTMPLLESIIDSASTVAESCQSSMASSTGLLSNSASARDRQRWTAPLGGPVRRRGRGTDLFTDDDLDMDSDIDLVLPPLPKQELLADFLRNVSPPHNHPRPTQLNGASNKVPKRASAANLINRLSRTQSLSEKTPMYRPLPVRSDLFGTPLYETQLQTVQTEFGDRSTDSAHSHFMTTSASERPPPSKIKPVGEARSARVEQSKGIDELAAFLRDSAPPSMGPAPDRRPDVKAKEEGNSSKFRFRSKGKRKEVVV